MMKQTIKESLENCIDNIFFDYQKANNIVSGDILPEQALEIDNLISNLCETIFDVMILQWYENQE